MKARLSIAVMLAALTLGALAVPAASDGAHTSIGLDCSVSPTTKNTASDVTCSYAFTDFGTTSNDKTEHVQLTFEGAQMNEVGDGNTDPAHGEKIGESTVSTELAFNSCDDNNTDGGTYSTYWVSQPNWTTPTHTAPANHTKVAQYRTEFRVLFFFTEQVYTHVYEDDNNAGSYTSITDMPYARACDGAQSSFSTTFYDASVTNGRMVGKNPVNAGDYTVTLTATEVGGTTHTDTDTVTITN